MPKLKLTLLADQSPAPSPEAEMLAFDIAAIARMTTLSVRHLRRLDCCGDIPGRFTVGRRVLYKADVIRRWIGLGMPDKATFESLVKRSK